MYAYIFVWSVATRGIHVEIGTETVKLKNRAAWTLFLL